MAHIGEYLNDPANIGLNNYIAREVSPKVSQESMSSSTTPSEEKEKFVWRMHQPSERKYQLFPSKDKVSLAAAGRASPDPEQAFAIAMAGNDRTMGTTLRMKAKEQLSRRRKPSVTDIGPMTTVQEVAMDSPTIPGRPPLHERSISAPGYHSYRQHMRNESPLSRLPESVLNEQEETGRLRGPQLSNKEATIAIRRRSDSPKRPFSPRTLAPLVIPTSSINRPHPVIVNNAPDTDLNKLLFSPNGAPPEVPPKSARMLDEKSGSPQNKVPYTPLTTASTASFLSLDFSPAQTTARTPWTPMTSNLSLPGSATINSTTSNCFSANTSRGPSPNSHQRGQSDASILSCAPRSTSQLSHRRGESEASVMDRGRPKKRFDGLRRVPSKATLEREQKAHETLPVGIKAADIGNEGSVFGIEECDFLRNQAIGQAGKFEVLRAKDVDDLSRELRALDERCDYLRRTHNSLRAGRRNLHERICTYLRSPRTAVFSHDSILKQEEALKELDQSIDGWVSKLEVAENRRMRVRQKLLEHVAAACLLQESVYKNNRKPSVELKRKNSTSEKQRSVSPTTIVKAQIAADNAATAATSCAAPHTPPRSPTKTSGRSTPSPTREALPPAPSPEPIIAKVIPANRESVQSSMGRPSAESIRIYVESDVYGLLADVEAEMERMTNENVVKKKGINAAGEVLGRGVFVPFRSATPTQRPVAEFA